MSATSEQLERIEHAGVSALVRAGDASRTVMCLHGIGSNAQSFSSLFAAWPQGPQLIAWDAPGYGASPAFDIHWPEPVAYASYLQSFLDACGIATVDLVGHSLGCLMAGAFATRLPTRMRHLALLSPALGYNVPRNSVLPPAIAARITDLELQGAEAFAAMRAARLVHRPEAKPAVVASVRTAMARVSLPGYAQAVRMLASGDLIAEARHIVAPTLILNGEDDVVTPKAGAQKLHAACSGSQLVLIPDAGHALPQEAPEHIAALLSRVFAGGAA